MEEGGGGARGGECKKNNVGYKMICDLCGGKNLCYEGKLDRMCILKY